MSKRWFEVIKSVSGQLISSRVRIDNPDRIENISKYGVCGYKNIKKKDCSKFVMRPVYSLKCKMQE